MSVIIATLKRNIITKKRAYPFEFFLGNLLGICFNILNAFFLYKILFDGNISETFIKYTNTNDYMSYTIVGYFIFMFVVGAVFSVSRSIITEIKTGTLDSIMITNMSTINYFLGNMLEHLLTISFEMIVALIVCIPFGVILNNINILSTIIYSFVSIIGVFGLVIIICGIMVYFKDTFIIQNTIFVLISLLCGLNFPIEYLPNCIQNISKIIPITYSLKLLRSSILNGDNIQLHLNEFIILMVLSLLYCFIGIFIVNKVIKRALENQFI